MNTRNLVLRSSLLATAAVLMMAAPALAASSSVVSTVAVGTQSGLSGVDLLSSSDGWAVGGSATSGGVIEHWNGQKFSVTASPDLVTHTGNNPSAGLRAVDALSSTAAFAVGTAWFYGSDGQQHSNAVVESWNGSTWSKLTVPNNPQVNSFTAVKAFSANDVWTVGRAGTQFSGATLAMHWDGTAWASVPTPSPGTRDNTLTAVSGTGPNDVWAVGYYRDLPYGNRDLHPIALHWNGSSWTQTPTAQIGTSTQTELKGVVALSPTNAWAVGYYNGVASGFGSAVLHWDGTAWSSVAAPNLAGLNSVTAISATDLWATGSEANGFPALANLNGSTWSISSAPLPGSPVSASLSMIAGTGANSLFSVGDTYVPSTGTSAPLAVRTDNG